MKLPDFCLKNVFGLLALGLCFADLSGRDLVLAENGKTAYSIVAADPDSIFGKMAVDDLKYFFRASTGAELPVSRTGTGGRHIYLGMTPETRKFFRGIEPRDQELFIRTHDGNLYIFGGGKFGTLYGVYEFLETQLGIRWFTPYENGTWIPKHEKLIIPELNIRSAPVFQYRYQPNWYVQAPDKAKFYLRNRINENQNAPSREYSTLPLEYAQCHTFFSYIRPDMNAHVWELQWPDPSEKSRTYFKDHPEYFSMGADGKRFPGQLCFSSREMRKELSRRLEIQVASRNGGKGVFNFSAQDVPGPFCCCGGCKALEKKYACSGGPLFDYLIEACNGFMTKYPEAMLSTLAYRKNQTEFPPNVEKLPDNLLIIFAPIDDDVTKTLDHSNNIGTYENLKKWTKLSKNVWIWYYVYYGGPCGVAGRMMKDTALFREAGANGTFYEFNNDFKVGLNFADLNTWLVMKSYWDPRLDAKKKIREFCDFYYGSASGEVVAWLADLEKHRMGIRNYLLWSDGSASWGYYTPEKNIEVQKMFDKWEAMTAREPMANRNIKALRIGSDIELIKSYPEMIGKYPAYKSGSKAVYERIEVRMKETGLEKRNPAVANLILKGLKDSLTVAEVIPLPLPEQFGSITDRKVIRLFPQKSRLTVQNEMKDAAYGLAFGVEVETPEKPFNCGFYDGVAKKFFHLDIPPRDLKKGTFAFYKIGTHKLSSICRIWVHPSWATGCDLGRFFDIDKPDKRWDMYVSLKFTGPAYNGTTGKNRVYIDQLLLIEAK
ncbi:MAG: hypothetical protein BWY31_00257 [Lentisphaerae bacterium ADurb.Bin242]|nr:MAG: hypothetical protein BWY31_00257 [Lentisphaerae bacterium ADurb.Bin242]